MSNLQQSSVQSSGGAGGRAAPAVLVTGASRGLGRGIAVELAAAGYSVAVNYRSNADAAAETLRLCEEAASRSAETAAGNGAPEGNAPPRFTAVQGDVALAEDRHRMVDETLAAFGGIYGLVNNAGISPRERNDITVATEESFQEVLQTNLTGPYFLTQLVVQHWLAESEDRGEAAAAGGDQGRRGIGDQEPPDPRHHIVFVTSISAATASINRGEYCVSKAGAAMAAELWATRLAPEGINVYEVRPGIMETDMTSGVHEKYSRLIGEGLVPQRRWGRPRDLGRICRGIMDNDLAFSTGAVIYSDGGFNISTL